MLDCYHLDYDGLRYVQTWSRFTIDKFDGLHTLSLLPVCPFSVSVKEGYVNREALLARGQQFMDCTTRACHRYYSGRTHFRSPKGIKLSDHPLKIPINVSMFSEKADSEVIVDFERALQEIPLWRSETDDTRLFQINDEETGDGDYYMDRDRVWDARFSEDFLQREREKLRQWEKLGSCPSTEDDILLLPDRVFAFVLRTRKWGKHTKDSIVSTSADEFSVSLLANWKEYGRIGTTYNYQTTI